MRINSMRRLKCSSPCPCNNSTTQNSNQCWYVMQPFVSFICVLASLFLVEFRRRILLFGFETQALTQRPQSHNTNSQKLASWRVSKRRKTKHRRSWRSKRIPTRWSRLVVPFPSLFTHVVLYLWWHSLVSSVSSSLLLFNSAKRSLMQWRTLSNSRTWTTSLLSKTLKTERFVAA